MIAGAARREGLLGDRALAYAMPGGVTAGRRVSSGAKAVSETISRF
jgi:hypothetical protein